VVIMGLFAVPLSFVNPRSGRSWNLIFAVLIYVVYNNMLSIFQAWTSSSRIPAWVGLWPVHLVMLAAVVLLFTRQMGGFRWAALVNPVESRGRAKV
jgi:lipopolysaccharide export system permease protein